MAQKKEKFFRWVHISDIHIGHDDYIEKAMRDDLPDFLKKEMGQKEVHCLFVTGDLIFAPKFTPESEKDDIANKEPFIDCIRNIRDSLGISSDKIFIVPGNHDIVRNSLRSTCLRDESKRYTSKNGILSTDAIQVNNTAKERFGRLYEKILGRPFQDGHHIEYTEDGCQIICLDTTLFSEVFQYGDKKEKAIPDGKLILGSKNLQECFSKVEADKFAVALGHHPMEAFLPSEREVFCREMRKTKVSLYLCGHTHTGSIGNIGTEEAPIWQVNCGTNMEKLKNGNQADMLIYIGEYSLTKKRGCIRHYCYYNRNLNRLGWTNELNIGFPRTAMEAELGVKMFYFPKGACPAEVALKKYEEWVGRIERGTELYVGPNIAMDSAALIEDPGEKTCIHCITADAGYGKSFFQKRLVRHFHTGKDSDSWTVPISLQTAYEQILMLPGKRLEDPLIRFDPVEFVARVPLELKNEGNFRYKDFFINWSKRCAKNGSQLILVDGLDGIGSEKQRVEFLESIGSYLEDNPDVDVVMTSRPYVFENGSLKEYMDGYTMYKMSELNDMQISEYCRLRTVHAEAEEDAAQLVAKIRDDNTVYELAKIPLLLETLFQVNSQNATLPNNRVALFREWIHVLLKESNRFEEDINLLAALALHMSRNNLYEIQENELKKLIKKIRENCDWYFIENSELPEETPRNFLDRLHRISRIMKCVETGKNKVWCFYHDIFQEYLASISVVNGIYPELDSELKSLNQGESRTHTPVFCELVEMAADSKKQDLVAFAVAQLGSYEASEVVEALIQELASIESGKYQVNYRNLLLQIILEGARINKNCRVKIYKAVQEQNLSDLQADVFLRMSASKYGEEFKMYCSPYMNEMFEVIRNYDEPVGELISRISDLEGHPGGDTEGQVEKLLYVLDGIIWATGLRFVEGVHGRDAGDVLDTILNLMNQIILNEKEDGISARRVCGVLHRILNIRPGFRLNKGMPARILRIFGHKVDKKYSTVQADADYSGIRVVNKIILDDEYLEEIQHLDLEAGEKACLRELFGSAPTIRDKCSAFWMSVLGKCWSGDEMHDIGHDNPEVLELCSGKTLETLEKKGFLQGSGLNVEGAAE